MQQRMDYELFFLCGGLIVLGIYVLWSAALGETTPEGVPATHTQAAGPAWDWQAEEDLFRRCAIKVAKGYYDCPEWKRQVYVKALRQGVKTAGLAKRTNYCPFCSGPTCTDGSHVRKGICAANPEIRIHCWIWLNSDGLLKVCDRGGWVKLGYVRSAGGYVTLPTESANVDAWCERCPGPHKSQRRNCWHGTGTKRNVPYAILGNSD